MGAALEGERDALGRAGRHPCHRPLAGPQPASRGGQGAGSRLRHRVRRAGPVIFCSTAYLLKARLIVECKRLIKNY
jgi:hypothetical protein